MKLTIKIVAYREIIVNLLITHAAETWNINRRLDEKEPKKAQFYLLFIRNA